ncbi:MAG: rhodanese-like domain-containing protein, partial [Alphaproteobacteria bacterium]
PPQGGFGQPPQGGFGQAPPGGFGQAAPGGFGQPPSGGFGQPPRGGDEQVRLPPGMNQQALQALAQQERQDLGAQPTAQLHRGPPHGATPTSIPGAKLIDTLGLVSMLGHQPPVPVVILDALGAPIGLPNAVPAAWAAGGNSFQDQTQQQLGQMLGQVTRGNRSIPVVVYCADPNCWMSYNVALRAAQLGYQNVLWYRGGLWAWQQAGMRTQPMQQQQQQQQRSQ